MLKAKVAFCPACSRRISVNASECPKCGEPLTGNWAEVQVKKEGKLYVWVILIIFAIIVLPQTCSKSDAAQAQERLPSECWAADEPIPSSCQGEVDGSLFPFCPSEELYEQVRNMMPQEAANYGCEADTDGRMVKVLSCDYTTCEYSLYYGYDNWQTMWSQSGIVNK